MPGAESAGSIVIDFDFTSAPSGTSRDAVLAWDQVTGSPRLVPLTRSADPDRARLLVTLDAGDVILFKYDDGIDFPLGPDPSSGT